MELTLAMGLKYEPGPGYSLLPDQKKGQGYSFVRPKNSETVMTEPVIEVEAVEVVQGRVVNTGSKIRRFEYLIYNLHAGVVLIPEIGTRLDAVI
ncbi:MAG: hypothetical protein R8K54_06485 [Mariprofundaceae bacterium]